MNDLNQSKRRAARLRHICGCILRTFRSRRRLLISKAAAYVFVDAVARGGGSYICRQKKDTVILLYQNKKESANWRIGNENKAFVYSQGKGTTNPP